MKKLIPKIIRGGRATNIKGNLYYMSGRKHEAGGIDIGKNPRTGLEVEDGEVVQTSPNGLKVFSAQPILNGNSPAKLVMGGANPDKVFQAQETFKDVNGINDDGSKKRMGGKVKIRRRTNAEIDEELGLVPNKNRKAAGGFVTVNGNVIDKLVGDVPFPSPTGGRKKAALGTDKRDKDYVVMNGQLYQVTNDEFGETAYLPVDERTPNSRLLDGRGAAARKSDRQVRAAAKRDAKASVANSSIPKGNNFIEPFNPVQYRATGNSAGSRSKNNSGSNRGFTVRRGSYDTRYPDASSYARDAAAQRKQVTDAASRDAKGARTDFRNMLEVPEFTPGTYSGGNRNTGTRSTNSAPQTRVTPIEEAPATTAATKASKPATSSAPRRRSGSSKSTKAAATATPTAAPKFASLDSMMQGLPTLSRNTPTTIPTRTVDGASTNAGVPDTISSPRKRLALFDKLDTNDIIGLAGNIGGSVASAITTRKALNDMEAPSEPMYEIPTAMKTHFNIRPQISEINENTRRSMDDVTANTASSRVALQRKQRLRNAGQYAKNNLYGQKENIETQLINQDRLNIQRVGSRNTAAYNDWRNRTTQFRNAIREQKASSLNNMFSGINAGLQDMLSRIENRRNYNNTLGIYDATHPNTDKRLFRDKGVTI